MVKASGYRVSKSGGATAELIWAGYTTYTYVFGIATMSSCPNKRHVVHFQSQNLTLKTPEIVDIS